MLAEIFWIPPAGRLAPVLVRLQKGGLNMKKLWQHAASKSTMALAPSEVRTLLLCHKLHAVGKGMPHVDTAA